MTLAQRAVDAAHALYGSHPGHRALHSKGLLFRGRFTATPEAAGLTRAGHMQGETVQATVRFSNGAGDPARPDYVQDARGLAVKLYVPDGEKTDLVAANTPTFVTRTPEDFVELLEARRPDPETGQPDMERLGAFLGAHPEAGPAIQHALSAKPPASYAQVRYFGLHAFRFVAADGSGRWVRYRWEPEAGVAELSEEEAKERGDDYLQEDISERVAGGPVAFTLVLQLGEEGDTTVDPTQPWPEERETVEAGRLEVTEPEPDREQGDDVLVFDPTRVIDGIELPDDPILHFRPRAYAVSVERRSGAPIPAGLG
jgi:catalase